MSPETLPPMRRGTVASDAVSRGPRFSSLAGLWLLGILLIHGGRVLAAVGVSAVDSVAVTVSDMARSEDFYARVLRFRKVADREVAGAEYERVFGISHLHVRAVRMQLGDEYIQLLQFITPRGRPDCRLAQQ